MPANKEKSLGDLALEELGEIEDLGLEQQENEDNEGDEVQPGKTKAETEAALEARLGAVERESTVATTAAAEARMMGKLMADPEISQILAARNQGKKVKIISAEDEEESESSSSSSPDEINSFSNAQLTEHILKRTEKVLDKIVGDQLRPISQQLQSQRAREQQVGIDAAEKEIIALRAMIPDFDTYIPAMRKIAPENPGISVTECFLLAQRRAKLGTTGLPPNGRPLSRSRQSADEEVELDEEGNPKDNGSEKTFSEKPNTGSAGRTGKAKTPQTPATNNKHNFRSLASASLDRFFAKQKK